MLWVYGLIAFILLVNQWFVLLVFSHRNRDLSDFIWGYPECTIHVMTYTYLMTDTQAKILSVKVQI